MNKDTSTDCRSCVYFNCRKYNGIDYDYINWCRHFQEELEDFIPCKNLTLSLFTSERIHSIYSILLSYRCSRIKKGWRKWIIIKKLHFQLFMIVF